MTPCALVAQVASGISYVIAPASRFDVSTGKAGVLGFAGHEHLIRARGFSGQVVYDRQNPSRSHVEVLVRTDSLEVLTPPDTAEIRQVTEAMRSQVLEVERYREIRFSTTAATPSRNGFLLRGDLAMHGQTRPITLEVQTEMRGDTLRATAKFSVLQTDFGIRPFRGGPGGTVRVADRVTFDLDILAIREPDR